MKFRYRNKEIDGILTGVYPGNGMLLLNGKRTVCHLKMFEPPPEFPFDLPIVGKFDKRLGRTFRYFKAEGEKWFSTGIRTIKLSDDMRSECFTNLFFILFILRKGKKILFAGVFFNRDILDIYERIVYSEECPMSFFQSVSTCINHQNAGLDHQYSLQDKFGKSWKRTAKPQKKYLLSSKPKFELEGNEIKVREPEKEPNRILGMVVQYLRIVLNKSEKR